ncbi:MAG: pantoate--beta-alanine ligase [Actinomycetota bacterium]
MEVIESGPKLRAHLDDARQGGRSVGFVPTMGALHDGHLSLMRRARQETDVVAISIFVNPLQFGDAADLASYPRLLEHDLRLAENTGVDVAFTPDEAEMYPNGQPEVTVHAGPIGDRLEGAARTGHFDGVATVVAKLFNLAGPCTAYFGQKDAQQLALIRRLVDDLDAPVTIVGCETVREPDGLAMSSRNLRLTNVQRAAAACLYRALAYAGRLAGEGERDGNVLKAEMAKRIGAEPLAKLDYVAIVDDATFEEVHQVSGPSRALVAARFGEIRLIDNLALPKQEGTVR